MSGDRFQTTRWSLVLSTRTRSTSEARQALSRLCEIYWGPLYAYVRRQGYGVDDARDLTQGYFCTLLEKGYLDQPDPAAGRLRWFLLASLKHFLSNERDRERAKKRGGEITHLPFDLAQAETWYRDLPGEQVTGETLYERRWAQRLIERTKQRLGEEFAGRDRHRSFELMRTHLTANEFAVPAADIAAELGMTEGAVRTAVHRLRRRFGEVLRDEVTQTVADPAEVDDELRHLMSILADQRA